MKKNKIILLAIFAFTAFFLSGSLWAQKNSLLRDSREARTAFVKTDESMNQLFNNSYGYVIFPHLGKGAIVVGAGGGHGTVYENGKAIGTAKMVQINVGAQVGGQAYREVIFFNTKDALDRFKQNRLEFSGQVSATAVKSGASANAKYTDDVLVYTEEISGLMLEASIGGQKFSYRPY